MTPILYIMNEIIQTWLKSLIYSMKSLYMQWNDSDMTPIFYILISKLYKNKLFRMHDSNPLQIGGNNWDMTQTIYIQWNNWDMTQIPYIFNGIFETWLKSHIYSMISLRHDSNPLYIQWNLWDMTQIPYIFNEIFETWLKSLIYSIKSLRHAINPLYIQWNLWDMTQIYTNSIKVAHT